MLKIWGRISSINVRKVVWAAQELGLAHERIDAGAAFGHTRSPHYLAKNPNAQIPLLEEGDFALWESNVIVRYLFAAHAPQHYPADLHQRFNAERWMDWQQTTFNPAGRDAFVQLVRTAPEQRNLPAVKHSIATTEALMALLDAHLANTRFVGGDSFGMADIPLGCEMHRWWGMADALFSAHQLARQTLDTWPHLQRWHAQLVARPGSRGVLDLPLS